MVADYQGTDGILLPVLTNFRLVKSVAVWRDMT